MARGKRKRDASSMADDDEQLEADASAALSGVLMPKVNPESVDEIQPKELTIYETM
jgi:hypothetical protein